MRGPERAVVFGVELLGEGEHRRALRQVGKRVVLLDPSRQPRIDAEQIGALQSNAGLRCLPQQAFAGTPARDGGDPVAALLTELCPFRLPQQPLALTFTS